MNNYVSANVKAILGIMVLVMLSPCYVVASTPAQLDKIIAVVNRDVITKSELDKKIAVMQRQKISASRKQVLNDLIDISLQLQLAKRAQIQINEKELDEIINNIAKSHNITLAQLKQTLVERDGIVFSEFRNQIREQALINRTQQQFLGGEIIVNEKDIAEILRNPPKISNVPTQYHVVDVLLEVADNCPPEKQQLIANVAKQMAVKIRKGQDIEKVVNEGQQSFKEQTEQIVSSSDLGWRTLDDMPVLFAKEIAKIGTNQVIGPLKAPNGFHLIKLLGINGTSPQQSKFTKEQAREIAYHHKLVEKLKPWLAELRASAYIKISQE